MRGVAALTLFLPVDPHLRPVGVDDVGKGAGRAGSRHARRAGLQAAARAAGALLSPAGDAAPWLWLVLARAAALLAVVMAWRLAQRLADGSLVAGAVAATGVMLAGGWLWHGALGNAEGLLLALALVAAERALDGHHRQALALGFAAALLRTEALPFLLAYVAWLWPRDTRARAPALAALAALPLLWLGPDLIGSGDALRSSERARIPNPGAPALSEHPALESAARAIGLAPTIVWAGVALALAGVLRRELLRLTLLPALAGAAWMALVALMSEAGLLGRGALCDAGGRADGDRRRGRRVVGSGGRPRQLRLRPVTVAVLLTVVALGEAAPGLADDVRSLRYEARLYGALDHAVAAAGGRDAVLRCAPLHSAPTIALAWRLRVPMSEISTETASAGIAFTARPFRGAPRGPALEPARAFRETGQAGDGACSPAADERGGTPPAAAPGSGRGGARPAHGLRRAAHPRHRQRLLDRRGALAGHRRASARGHPGTARPGRLAAPLLPAAASVDGTRRHGRGGHRALSLLAALATVPAALWAGLRACSASAPAGPRRAAAATPAPHAYAQETRMYALLALLSLLVTAAFVLAFVRGRRRAPAAFALARPRCSLYTHNWGAVPAAGAGARCRWPRAPAAVARWPATRPWPRSWRPPRTRRGCPRSLDQARHTGAPWSTRRTSGALSTRSRFRWARV